MAWEIPSDTFDPEKLDGFDNAAPGRYHVEVVSVDDEATSKSGSPQMQVDYEVLAGTPDDQEGKPHRDYFARTDKAFKRALIFAVATGLTTKEELQQLKAAGKNPTIDFTLAVGRQLCVEIEPGEYKGKPKGEIGFGMWHVDAEDAKAIPKNQGKLNELGNPTNDAGPADGDNPFV